MTPHAARKKCPTCNGTGKVMGKDFEMKACWTCGGSGAVNE